MDMHIFSEVIKIKDGVLYNYPIHAERIRKTVRHFYGKELSLRLTSGDIPDNLRKGIVKCRIEYSDIILSVAFSQYDYKVLNSVALIENDAIEYPFKFADRQSLNDLLSSSGCDEIIIVKNGHVTDASFSNLVFENKSGLYTPDTCLLPGTKRQNLLDKGIIEERCITPKDLDGYEKIYFINAMMDICDNISVPVNSVIL